MGNKRLGRMKKLEWVDDQVTLFNVAVHRRPQKIPEFDSWLVSVEVDEKRIEVSALDGDDVDVCAHKLALATLAIYDVPIPQELVEIVNRNARKFAGEEG